MALGAGGALDRAMASARPVTLKLGAERTTSGLWLTPSNAYAAYAFAHGAGAGMTHKSMAAVAEGLAERGVATLRYNFPYMDAGGKRPDPPKLCHETVRAAVAEAAVRGNGLPLFAGGRSFGGRMTSQAQAIDALPNVRGLVFFAFPLHPAGKPSIERAAHLDDVAIPMLFLQGTQDALAERDLLEPMVAKLGARAQLTLFEHADHSFHAPARSGRKDADILREALDVTDAWMRKLA